MSWKKECKGYRWILDSRLREEDLGALWETFPRVEELPGAHVLKANRLRTVAHLPLAALHAGKGPRALSPERLPAGGLIVKVYRYPSLRDRLRYFVIRHRALQERHALTRLKEMGLPVPECFGAATLRKTGAVRGGGLLVEFLSDTVSLSSRLARLDEAARDDVGEGNSAAESVPAPPTARNELLARVGQLARLLHDRGAWHRDLHGGNILCLSAEDSLRLIDVHSCIFLPFMIRRLRRQGVAKLMHSLGELLSPDERRLLLSSYGTEALAAGGEASVEDAILQSVARLETTRLRSRSKRCFLSSTRFAVGRERGAVTFHIRTWSPQQLDHLWKVAVGESSRQDESGVGHSDPSRRTSLEGRDFLVRKRRYSLLESLRSLVCSHPLRRFYACGHALWVHELPTPAVVALRETRRLGLVRAAYLAVEIEGEWVTLDRELNDSSASGRTAPAEGARRRHALTRAVGALLRRLHDARLEFRALSPRNVLVRTDVPVERDDGGAPPAPALCIVDPDFRVLPRPPSRTQRLSGLFGFAESLLSRVGRTDLLRGLRAYAADDADWRLLAREAIRNSLTAGR